MAHNRQVAFLFDEAGAFTKEKIGGKALSLVTMARLGLSVPPGFAITTGVCRAYLEHARYPKRLEWHVNRCMRSLERKTGKRFGDPSNPLLVSVRSGAPVSMPGMMDTILNLGINEAMLPALEKLGGAKFARDTFDRFRAGFMKIVGSEISDPWEQLRLAFEAVSMSWLNDRAVEYRHARNIPDNLGTAMIVQQMVFGNLDDKSGTGVFFTRNVATGDQEPYGEFLPEGQGEDVVGGGVTPLPIAKLAELHPSVYQELLKWGEVLERKYREVIDVEFTVESGKLWILQSRLAKRTPIAAARFAVQLKLEGQITKKEAVGRLEDDEVARLRVQEFNAQAVEAAQQLSRVVAHGLPASPGAAVGIVVLSATQAQKLAREGKQVVLIRPETDPGDFAGMRVSAAIVTIKGGVSSHAAVTACEFGKPAVVGASDIIIGLRTDRDSIRSLLTPPPGIFEGDVVSVDGTRGLVIHGTLPLVYVSGGKEIARFLKWYRELHPRKQCKADFSAVDRVHSANQILNDIYLTRLMASAVVGTELEKEAGALSNRVCQEAAEIFAAYLITAIAGELRHGWILLDEDRKKLPVNQQHWKVPEFAVLAQRHGLLPLANEVSKRGDAQMSVVNRLRGASLVVHKDFLELAVPAFNSWDAGFGVGGPAWAEIAKTVLDYLKGDLTDMAFVDRVFDLRHNGDALFNKHRMFTAYDAHRWEATLQMQLNAKRDARSLDELVIKLAKVCVPDQYVAELLFEQKECGVAPEVAMLWKKGKGTLWWKNPPGDSRAALRG